MAAIPRPVARTSEPASIEGETRLQVGDVRIDLRYRRIEHADGSCELPQRMFELLLLFLAQPHVLHSRADLFRRVWAGVVVEDANLSQSVWVLRKALGPTRKHWIRTVAKRGYVFEPPTAVTPLALPELPAAGVEHDTGRDAAPAPIAAAVARSRPRRRPWPAVAALLLVAALLGGWLALPTPAAPSRVVALIEVGDPAADLRWPARLLRAWLAFKLGHLPEVVVQGEAHLAVDATDATSTVVLLASGPVPGGDDDTLFIRALVGHGGERRAFEVRGSLAEVPALVAQLSTRVLADLLPERADAPWPPLALEPAQARAFSDAFDAFDRRDWARAVPQLRALLQQAPGFGLARLQLATALSRLGQSGAAREQMAAARAALLPLPADAERVLDAAQQAIDPQRHLQAAAAYARLAARHPERRDFPLEQARLLARAGRAEQAQAVLEQAPAGAEPTSVRISRLLALAEVQLTLGHLQRGRATAERAAGLAAKAGAGWALEHGTALLLIAQAEQAMQHDQADLTLFERAAERFDAAGSSINATYARFLADLARSPLHADGPALELLLSEARKGGHRAIEINLLRRVAYRHLLAGDHPAYRLRLEQALAAADAAGDPLWQRHLDLDLLHEDLLRGDLAAADQRLLRLSRGPLEGDPALWAGQFDALIASIRGDFTRAEARLAEALAAAGEQVPPLSRARLACAQTELHLQRGRLQASRDAAAGCGAIAVPPLQLLAALSTAAIDLAAGDRAAALPRLQQLAASFEGDADGPDRWLPMLAVADLALRAGDGGAARRLYADVHARAGDAGYDWLLAHADTGLAEVAAAQGDWTLSRDHLTAARGRLADDAWALQRRLRQLELAAALADDAHDTVAALAASLDAEAHARGDMVAMLELHRLLPDALALEGCTADSRQALREDSELRGVDLAWLGSPLDTDTPVIAHSE